MNFGSVLLAICAAVYVLVATVALVSIRTHRAWVFAASCGATAAWALSGAASGVVSVHGLNGVLDFARMAGWYSYLLMLYRRSEVGTRPQFLWLASALLLSALFGGADAALHSVAAPATLTLLSPSILSRLTLATCQLLLIENLYLNVSEQERWHVAVPCAVLGALACFDLLAAADIVLYHRTSLPLSYARVVVMVVVAPLLLLGASRDKRWRKPLKMSRAAVFHSATLVLSGSVMLSLAAAGELLRSFDQTWGVVAELSLVFVGVLGLVLFLGSKSGRSLIHRAVVHHFFADQYDYRRQWLACIDTLSGTGYGERPPLHARAIRAVADVVDSPQGVLFLRDGPAGSLNWAGSWNMPACPSLPADHAVVAQTRQGEWIVDLRALDPTLLQLSPFSELGRVWLAIPLLHLDGIIGLVVVSPPRVPFKTTQEVFDLLRILGREVATYIREQRATETMLQTRDLLDYSKRFAFVAHDIKNVSSQLAMLLQNAEHHISNPDFQQDMLETVRASVQKISALLKRLEAPAVASAPTTIVPVSRLEALIAAYQRVRKANITLTHDGSTGRVVMGADAFDTAVTHLINNAVEASNNQAVVVRATHEAERLVIDVVDHGPGMSPDFVRDRLFTPFQTQKQGGSGIGAFQARELLREAGAELVVHSQVGLGTTMRILLARADQAGPSEPTRQDLALAGGANG